MLRKSISQIQFAIVIVLLMVIGSCANKETKNISRCLELVQDVENLQKQLPKQIVEGVTLVRAEYKDSVYSTWYEIDDKGISFEKMSSMLEKRRKEILDDVSVSDGTDRHNYELYVEYNIRMRLIYCGKTTHKQIEFTITPSEINEALHTKADAYKKLQMLINSTKFITADSNGSTSTPDIALKDSTVYITITIDEDHYNINGMGIEDKEQAKSDIMAEMRSLNPKLIRYMADANCSLCYLVIGLHSKVESNIDISSSEIILNKVILDADEKLKSEIVESDE